MIKSVVFDFNGVILNLDTHDADPGMIELVEELFVLGLKLHIFSNTSRVVIEKLDSKNDFLKYFDKIVLAEDTGFSKPSDSAFENLVKLLEEPENEIVYVDDGMNNLKQAEKYGMNSVKYIDPHRLRICLTSLEDLN
jgi:HAD superfamily hydrolase (TIGR01509 family)